MTAPVTFYRDPAKRLEQLHEAERSCRVCVYNLRRTRACLHPRAKGNYPHGGGHCRGFKHKER